MRRVWNKTQDQIAHEWDAIAGLRSEQIRKGKDISYDHILTPAIFEMVHCGDLSAVLDVGCGCGFLTGKIAAIAGKVTGIDISPTSIGLARDHCKEFVNVRFLNVAVEQLSSNLQGEAFSFAVANMSLMAMLHLEAAVVAIAGLVRRGGHLALTITHPCFWPQYWNYSKEWFKYAEENVIEAPFHISLDQSDHFVTTHIHRPLERYVSALEQAGFRFVRVLEPMPSSTIERLYPQPWEYPRFLGALCVREE